MKKLRKLKPSEQQDNWGEFGIVENGKVLFQGTYEGCLMWLKSGN